MSAAQQLMASFGAAAPLGVSQVFSATTYTGTGVAFDVVNGIDLAGKGGMVWDKSTDDLARPNHHIFDTQRSFYVLVPNSTAAQYGESRSYRSNGYNVTPSYESNTPGKKYISWTFRRAPKFFDVVTYTGDGASSQIVSHSLGAVPGVIIVKNTGSAGEWYVWHKDYSNLNGTAPSTYCIGALNRSGAFSSLYAESIYFPSLPTSGQFGVGSNGNLSGNSYVAYLFAHDTGAEGLIRCGGYTGNGSATGPTVTLGWEPQFLMIRNASGTGDWVMYDSARDATNPRTATLLANSSAAESVVGPDIDFTSAGFQIKSSAANVNTSGSTYIYMAIRKP